MSQPSTEARTHDSMDATYLSQDDVERLLREDSPDARVNVLEKISNHYSTKTFHEREFMFAEQIFRLLMKDAELRVRQTLAERVKDNPDIPRDVILHLAQDVEQVSLPVLQVSQVLSDADLIHIIETSREVGKLVAISKRGRVSDRVSHALVETHYPQVVKSLLDNDGANIADQDYEAILNEFHHEEAITASLVRRAKLPMPLVEKLVNFVSDALAEQLHEKYQINTDTAEQEAREHITLELMAHNSSDEEIEATIAQMMLYNRLSPSIILSSLCRGYLRFFEIALARLTGIPTGNAQRLIRDKGPLGFRAIYGKTELPESMFDAVNVLLHTVLDLQDAGEQVGTQHYINSMVERLLQEGSERDIENLPYIIALIRQTSTH